MLQDTLDSFFKAIIAALGVTKPLIEDHLAQKYESESRARLNEWQNITSIPNDQIRADSEFQFIIKLCNDAGTPAGGFGRNVSVPFSILHALVVGNINLIKSKEVLASATFAL